jgi:polysaccharide pyruvyl transferase WcaK-like protein
MREMVQGQTMRQALINNDLKPQDIMFNYNSRSLARILENIQNKKQIQKLKNLSADLAEQRNIAKLIYNCYDNLYRKRIVSRLQIAESAAFNYQ